MERLTFEGNFCEIARCKEVKCPYDTDCSQKQVWERLKQYEDSKLSPEDAENLHAILRLGDGMTLMRLRELAVADKDGRCVVPPCKVGDMVWVIAHPWTGKLQKKTIGSLCEWHEVVHTRLICERAFRYHQNQWNEGL